MQTKPQRIYSIDMLKGICMIGMLMDHWRDSLARTGQSILGPHSPLPINASLLDYVDTASFWLRCTGGYIVAPAFVFLAGASCCLWQIRHAGQASLFSYLACRGIMLAILNCLLFFHAPFSQNGSITLFVLWAVGIGMIFLACMTKWPKALLWAISIVCIAGQNMFETITFSSPIINTLWSLGFKNVSLALPWGAEIYNSWPVIPWLGILLLGYLCGPIFKQDQKSSTSWVKLGSFCLALFLILRLTGMYGDSSLWHIHDSTIKTLGALIAVDKYPPSLQFSLYCLGITFLCLALLEKYQWTNKMLITLGSTPLFFYVAHFVFIRGLKFITLRLPTTFLNTIKDFLFSTAGVLVGTILMTLSLWLLCEQYKKIIKKMRTKKQQTA